MKVLIKDSKSGQYLAPHGTWTAGANHALDFHSTAAAYAMLHEDKVPRLLVVLHFEEVAYEVHVRKGHGKRRFPSPTLSTVSF